MPKRTALLILNSEYVDPGIAKLPRAQAAVDSLSSVLSSPHAGDFETTLLQNENVQTLREHLARSFKDQQEEDILLVYYAGHALQDQFGGMYFAATNTQVDVLDATGLPLQLLRDQLDRTRSNRNLIILDCPTIAAYSGAREVLGSASPILESLEGDRRGRMIIASSDIVSGSLEGDQVFGDAASSTLSHLLVRGLA